MSDDDVFQGSFTPTSELESRIANPAERAKRRQQTARETPAEPTESTETESDTASQDPRYDDDGLPREVVISAPGSPGRLVPYATFKERHRSVYTQVDEGRLTVPGFVTSAVRLLRQEWEVRTLRRREQESLQAVARRAAENDALSGQLEVTRLAVQVTKYRGEALEPLPEFTVDKLDDWLKHKVVKERVAMFRNMAQEVVDYLILHIMEVHQAVQFAVHESSINP